MKEKSTSTWMRGLPGLAVLAIALPLIAACGDDEVAEEEAVEPPAVEEGAVETPEVEEEGTVVEEGAVEAPVGDATVDEPAAGGVAEEPGTAIEETLEQTEDAIETVPEQPAASQ